MSPPAQKLSFVEKTGYSAANVADVFNSIVNMIGTATVKGRTSYPLLFDRNCQPKPAFAAVLGTAHGKSN